MHERIRVCAYVFRVGSFVRTRVCARIRASELGVRAYSYACGYMLRVGGVGAFTLDMPILVAPDAFTIGKKGATKIEYFFALKDA